MEHGKHLWRAGLLLFFATAAFFLGRGFLVPETFGDYGHFRGANLEEQRKVYVSRHGAGVESCSPCHQERAGEIVETAHKVINCEVCHAPLSTHVAYDSIEAFMENPGQFEKTHDMLIQLSEDLCPRCHTKQPAKPTGHPQVAVVEHLQEMGAEKGPNICIECHNPHDPAM